MKPTIGRIVHYYPKNIRVNQTPKPVAAIITNIQQDGNVGLTLFKPGEVDHRLNVQYSEDPAVLPRWCWPPREA